MNSEVMSDPDLDKFMEKLNARELSKQEIARRVSEWRPKTREEEIKELQQQNEILKQELNKANDEIKRIKKQDYQKQRYEKQKDKNQQAKDFMNLTEHHQYRIVNETWDYVKANSNSKIILFPRSFTR